MDSFNTLIDTELSDIRDAILSVYDCNSDEDIRSQILTEMHVISLAILHKQ